MLFPLVPVDHAWVGNYSPEENTVRLAEQPRLWFFSCLLVHISLVGTIQRALIFHVPRDTEFLTFKELLFKIVSIVDAGIPLSRLRIYYKIS